MDERIVNFADMAFKLRRRRTLFEKDRCEHLHIELDENGGIVTCMDCKKELSPFSALLHMAERSCRLRARKMFVGSSSFSRPVIAARL
jgi:hypothetical protein